MVSRLFLIYKQMNRIILLILFSILSLSIGFAQDISESKSVEPFEYNTENNKTYKPRKKYRNLGFVNTIMQQDGMPELKSNYGASLTIGRTFFLHKNPIGGFLRLGIDATWFDLNYTNYKIKHITYWETYRYEYLQGDLSVHIGPSVTLTPTPKLYIHGYFRYAPTLSALYMDEVLYMGGDTFWIYGASISYGTIGVGFEHRNRGCGYGEVDWESEEHEYTPAFNSVFEGWKVYLTFRF